MRALSCAHRQSSPSLCPVPPLFSPREEPEPWCKPRTLQGASTSFEYNGRLQYWTVPETGVYRITARGAKAADGHHRCAARSNPSQMRLRHHCPFILLQDLIYWEEAVLAARVVRLMRAGAAGTAAAGRS